MGKPLRVLMVEDSEDDVLLAIREIKKGGYDPLYERVENAGAMRKALEKGSWDIILCDYQMPQFNGLAAIALLKETGIDIPLIIVSGAIGEETAVECMRSGAQDYVMKGNLSRLVSAIERELKEAESRTQREQAEENLSRVMQHLTAHIANSPLAVVEFDSQIRVIRWSKEAERVFGWTEEEVLGRAISEIRWGYEEDEELVHRESADLLSGERSCSLNVNRNYRKDGSVIYCEWYNSGIYDSHGKLISILSLVLDITKRKKTEETLQESKALLANAFNNSPLLMTISDMATGMYLEVNDSFCVVSGFSREEAIGRTSIELGWISAEDRGRLANELKKHGRITSLELALRNKTGKTIICRYSGDIIQTAGGSRLFSVADDITEHKHAEEALQESEANYKQLFDNAPAAIYQINFRTGKFIKANDVLCEYIGCSQEEITSLNPYDCMTKESQKLLLERLNKMAQGDKVPEDPEYEMIDKNRKRRWIQLNSKNIYDSEGLFGADVVAHDITDRKQSEKTLQESEAKYRTIFENAIEGIYQATPEGRYVSANPAFAKILGYKTPEELISSITDVASQVYVTPDERSELIKQLSVSDLVEEFEFQAYRKDGTIVWLLANARVIRDENGNIEYFEGRVQDITRRKRVEDELKNTLESLRKAFGATIQAMVSAVETRDPYTSGHQLRSADLSRAIATEMGLPQEKIEGMRIAGSIHDIGKLSIPAEILSKPTKLTNIEFSLIKEHARTGFEMLKDVESPWPLAEIVYQHHERMDGSGYPRNLTGDKILMEARILAVSDVVESMASHRPYRPALGLNAALDEIENNGGTLYDNAVADACLRLFREKGFKLEGT
jgi:PAS domain S-box-containing protein